MPQLGLSPSFPHRITYLPRPVRHCPRLNDNLWLAFLCSRFELRGERKEIISFSYFFPYFIYFPFHLILSNLKRKQTRSFYSVFPLSFLTFIFFSFPFYPLMKFGNTHSSVSFPFSSLNETQEHNTLLLSLHYFSFLFFNKISFLFFNETQEHNV